MYFFKAILSALGLTFSIWFIRLFNEGVTFTSNSIENFWLWVLRPSLLIILGVGFIFTHINALNQMQRSRYILFAYSAAALFCLPYLPDMFASFVKAGESRSVVLSVAFYGLGILTYGTIRGGGVYLGHRLICLKLKSNTTQAMALYPIILAIEFFFFHTWHPITYFPALPLPIPAARFEQSHPKTNLKYLLVESYIDGKVRQEIKKGGQLSLSLLGKKISDAIKVKAQDSTFNSAVHIILPETFVSIDDPNDIHALVQPVAEELFLQKAVGKLIWIQGAFLNHSNVVLGTEVSRTEADQYSQTTALPKVTVLRKKIDQMPMFEAASKGISYSTLEEQQSDLTEDKIPETQTTLSEFVGKHQIMICYESLFPSRWTRGKPSVVLTNHHLFTEYKLMNWVYFGFLRYLSFLFGSETKVVSNFNPSGVLLKPMNDDDSATEPWAVVQVSAGYEQ